MTGRDVGRLARGRSQSSIQRALNRLVESGAVHAQEAGRAMLYTLNRDHVVVEPALALLGLRDDLLRRIGGSVETWTIAPEHVSVYGSTARGDGDENSDVDLFIIRPAGIDEEDERWRDQIARLARNIRAWSGNSASISEVGQRELQRLRRERPAVVSSLESEARTLFGLPVGRILRPGG